MNDLIIRSRLAPLDLPIIAGFAHKIDLHTQSCAYSDQCLIDANNDVEAVQTWLAQYSHKNTTYFTYKRESDRLLLWCVHEVGKSLRQLKVEDLSQYIEFLSKPPKRWCTTVGGIRTSGHGVDKWRPFLGPLSISARNTAIRVVNSLLNFLVDASYLRANPLRLIKQRGKFDIKSEDYKYSVWSKILDDNEWQALQQVLKDMPETTNFEKDNKKRCQFIFACMYLLGLRISEVAGSTWNAFKFHQGAWWFFVKGKGDKLGHIPVNEQLLALVKSYRTHLGKSQLPGDTDTQYLIVSKKTGGPLSIKQIYSLIKAIGLQAADKFGPKSSSYAKLRGLSPHSLRHLSASHQDRAGISMNMIQENLRHSSINTTKIYVHADDMARSAAMEKISLDIQSCSSEILDRDVELVISLKGHNVCTSYALAQLLNIIETKIFSGVKWRRIEDKLDIILCEYIQASSVGHWYKIQYLISDCIDRNIIIQHQTIITREAEIRLFTADVSIVYGN